MILSVDPDFKRDTLDLIFSAKDASPEKLQVLVKAMGEMGDAYEKDVVTLEGLKKRFPENKEFVAITTKAMGDIVGAALRRSHSTSNLCDIPHGNVPGHK